MPTSRPVNQDDLKAVRGIGRKVEARLKEAGITNLGQLARTPVNELAAILAGLAGRFDLDRIVREDWLAQAAQLAANSPEQDEAVETIAPVRHHFIIEVRRALAGGQIDSSRIVHVETRDEEAWRGWNPRQLVAFIEERSYHARGTAGTPRSGDAIHRRNSDGSEAGKSLPHGPTVQAGSSGSPSTVYVRYRPSTDRSASGCYARPPANRDGEHLAGTAEVGSAQSTAGRTC